MKAALEKYTDEQVLKAVHAVRQNLPVERKPIRTAEFEQLISAPAEAPGDLPRAEDAFYARGFKPKEGLPDKVSQVVLVRKLREVRAQVGFTRIEPVTPDLQGEFDLGVQSQVLGLTTDWVPRVRDSGGRGLPPARREGGPRLGESPGRFDERSGASQRLRRLGGTNQEQA